jgi:hypothetical protein
MFQPSNILYLITINNIKTQFSDQASARVARFSRKCSHNVPQPLPNLITLIHLSEQNKSSFFNLRRLSQV